MDFALMYVPSEAVFYEIVVMDELVEYARRQRVYIVSPTTLCAHISRQFYFPSKAERLKNNPKKSYVYCGVLQIDYDKVNDSIDILGKHIGNASSQYLNVNKSFLGMGQKLASIKQLSTNVKKKTKQTALPK